MLRASATVPKLIPKTTLVPKRRIKLSNFLNSSDFSSPPQKKGGVFKKLFALSLVSGSAVVGYSWYDQEFRKLLEDNVPYAKEAFGSFFEYLPDKNEVTKMFSKDAEVVKPQQIQKEIVKPAPVVEKTKKEIEADKKREAERLLREKKDNEMKRIADMEHRLQQQSEALKARVAAVIEAAKNASEVAKMHSKKLKGALQESSEEDEWQEVTASQDHRAHAFTAYEDLQTQAKEALRQLSAQVDQVKNDKSLKSNKIVSAVSSQLNKFSKELEHATKQFSKAHSEVTAFSEYKNLVKKGKERFKKELESVMPSFNDVTDASSYSSMSEENLSAIIGYAHRRIDQLQKKLAQQEALEKMRIDDAVERQKQEDKALTEMGISKEKEAWRKKLHLVKANWDVQAKEEFEKELKQTMTRQTAAHNEHLSEALKAQKHQLQLEFELKLNAHVQEEKRQFQKEVALWIARMKAVEEAIEKRAQFEKQSHQVQRLWLACEALQTAIATGNTKGTTWQERLKPLAAEVELIKQSFPDQPAIRDILNSMPEAALSRGVWTEGALIERFKKVEKVCRRVAMVDETAGLNGSIFRYFLSSLQAKLVVPGVSKIYESADEVVDVKELSNVFLLLDNAQACLDKGDLTQAVRFVNHLKGEPRKAVSDWLDEARLLLEIKQLSTALLASASAAGFSSIAATT